MSPLFEGDIPKELADRGAVSIYTSEYPPMSYRDESDKPDESESEEEPNKCSMSADEAANRARDYMAEWGVDDTAVLSVADMYVEYDDDEGYAVDYEKKWLCSHFECCGEWRSDISASGIWSGYHIWQK